MTRQTKDMETCHMTVRRSTMQLALDLRTAIEPKTLRPHHIGSERAAPNNAARHGRRRNAYAAHSSSLRDPPLLCSCPRYADLPPTDTPRRGKGELDGMDTLFARRHGGWDGLSGARRRDFS